MVISKNFAKYFVIKEEIEEHNIIKGYTLMYQI